MAAIVVNPHRQGRAGKLKYGTKKAGAERKSRKRYAKVAINTETIPFREIGVQHSEVIGCARAGFDTGTQRYTLGAKQS
ncbi:MAG: hypothetical protein KA084_02150 [Brachymonas sp.]|jgi:hypothetical protein|nr:hypothetical protein [Brachymonas sp.]MBP6966515.1 hypothetical protein [Brachymonas sp.]MBP7246817.1 hypothetical protein [Brachymonas sp.]MBP7724691.1 hypothetical protein [Brachymonas sp.]MBP7734176.1 hypothetical protein [Brachymonas sp.]